MNKKLFFICVAVGFSLMQAKGGGTYSCTAVLADEYYVPPGEVLYVNAQVDCFFITGFGSSIGASQPIDIALDKAAVNKISAFTQDAAMKLAQLQTYPKQGALFAFEYVPMKGKSQLAGVPIQVVIRTETASRELKAILNEQLKDAQSVRDTTRVNELNALLNNIDTKGIVQFYRRIPAIGETKFKPMHTKIFADSPEQEVADIRILPTGNLQIVEHTQDGKKLLVEESFGRL